MGLFDHILQPQPPEGSQEPQGSAPASGGLFGHILSPGSAPAAPAAPQAPADFDQRFEGDAAAARPAMASGLEGHAQATMGMPSRTQAAALGFARGNLMEFADEAAAGVNATIDAVGGAPWGESYDRHLTHGRQVLRDNQVAHPGTTMLGQAGGAMVSPSPGGSVARQAAIQGGITGIGSGEGFTDRLTQGVVGTAVGGAVGKGIETVTRSGRALLSYGKNAVQSLVRPHAAAGRKISNAMAQDVANGTQGLDDQAYAAAAQRGQPVAAVDQGGEATRTLARNAADVSPDARAALERNLTQPRFEQQGGRTTEFMRSMFGRGVEDPELRQDQLRDAGRQALRPLYERAYADGDSDLWTPQLAHLAQAPMVEQALKLAVKNANNHAIANGFAPMNPRVTLDDADRIVFGRGGMPSFPNLQLWDFTKRELDKMARGANADPDAGRFANMLRTHLDELVPSYRNARSTAESFFGARDALEAGQTFVASKHRNDAARRAFQAMPQAEQELFAEGFAGQLVNQVKEVGDSRNLLIDKLFKSGAARERIEIALGPQRAREIETFMRAEHAMQLVHQAVSSGSRTAMLQAGRDAAFVGLGGLAGSSLDGSMVNTNDPAAMFGALLAGGVAMGNRRVAAEVGRRLASNDPQLMQEALRTVARSQVLSARLRAVEAHLAKSVAPQAAAAARPMTDVAVGGARSALSADPPEKEQR
ncbi:MAG: hypothetical protein K0S96_1031 [Geminicoccaceae bacterium]|nr:hypothetical protein [Geminicoccaceae bacterium]